MLIIHVWFIMLMTIDTAEYGIVGRVGMAVGAGIPLPLVLS